MAYTDKKIDKTSRDYYDKLVGSLRNELQSYVPWYRELSEFITPRRGRFLTTDIKNRGNKNSYKSIINSVASQAHKVCRAGMTAGGMSRTRPWFRLQTPDPDLMEVQAVKIWLNQVEFIIRKVLDDSNFYAMATSLIGELITYGTAFMTHVDDYEDVARFYTHTAGSYMIAQNGRLDIDTVVREYEQTAEALISEFGYDNVSASVKTAYDNGSYMTFFPVVHVIHPNPGYDAASYSSKRKGYRSCYYEPAEPNKSRYLREAGFDYFPGYVPRWDTTDGDIYGSDSPAMTALGDIKGVQIKEKRGAQGLDKMIAPPMGGPPSTKNIPVIGLPGGMTAYDAGPGNQKIEALYNVRLPLGELTQTVQRDEQRIKEAFFNDLFRAISDMEGIQPRNEFDLTQRNQERLLQIGPVIYRLNDDFLGGVVKRIYVQCSKAGILPPPPREIAGKILGLRYVSTLAMAQEAVNTGPTQQFATYIAQLGTVRPDAWDKFNIDESIDDMAKGLGVNPKLVVPNDVAHQIRQDRIAAQQQAQQLAATQAAAGAAKDGASAVHSLVGSVASLAGPQRSQPAVGGPVNG